ncbi:hypothetical protein D3C73_1475840 [compost metagenome]
MDKRIKQRNNRVPAVNTRNKFPRLSASLPIFLPINAATTAAGNITKPMAKGDSPLIRVRNCGVIKGIPKLIDVAMKAINSPKE